MAFAFYKWIIFLQLAKQGSSQFLCPPAEIGSSVELICNHKNSATINFNTPSGPTAVACTPTCSVASRYNGSNINETQTRLTILKVEHRDRGTWTCQYGGEEEFVQCNLNLYTIPYCKISSDQDTSSLTLGKEITLYLNVNNAYCDEDNKLTLTSGDDVHIFTGRHGVTFSEIFNTSYIVTDKHLGPVRSSFQCGNQILNISCSGVTNLQRAVSDGNHSEVTAAWIVPVAATVGVIVAAVVAVAVVFVVRRKRNPENHKKKDKIPLTKLADDANTYASINDNLTIDDTTTFNSHQGNKEPEMSPKADVMDPTHCDKKADMSDNKETNPEAMYAVVNKKKPSDMR